MLWKRFFKVFAFIIIFLVAMIVLFNKVGNLPGELLIFPILMGIYYIFEYYFKNFKSLMESFEEKEINEQEFWEDVLAGQKIGTSLIGTKYLLCFGNRRVGIRYSDIMWVYINQASKSLKVWSIGIVTGQSERYFINNIYSEEETNYVISLIQAKCPGVLVGFTKEINKTFMHDYKTFSYCVEQLKAANRR